MPLKEPVTRKTSTALPWKTLWVPAKGNSSFLPLPLWFGAPSSKCSKSSSGGCDQPMRQCHPRKVPWARPFSVTLGSTSSLWGALQTSSHKCGVSQMLWGAPGLNVREVVLGPWDKLPVPRGQPVEPVLLAWGLVIFNSRPIAYRPLVLLLASKMFCVHWIVHW